MAACKGCGPDLWFPADSNAWSTPGRDACERCPVRLDCLHDAYWMEVGVNKHLIFGIRGGLSSNARIEAMQMVPVTLRTEHRELAA